MSQSADEKDDVKLLPSASSINSENSFQYYKHRLQQFLHSTVAYFKDPSNLFRYLVLLLLCLEVLCVTFPGEAFGVMQYRIREGLVEGKNLTQSEYNLFFSASSMPNIVTPLIGGFLIDAVFGVRLGTIIILCLAAVGTLIMALAPYVPAMGAYWVMVLGRFVFGAGGETMLVAQNTIIAQWFGGKEISFAFGLALSAARLGTTLTYNTSESLAKWIGSYKACLWVGFGFAVLSIFIGFLYIFVDRYGTKKQYAPAKAPDNGTISIRHIAQFKPIFWVFILAACTYYSLVYPFSALAPGMLEHRYYHDAEVAGRVASILPLTSMIFAPIFGFFIDRFGFRIFLASVSIAALIPCLSGLALTHMTPIPAMIVTGLVFALVPAATTPCIPIMIPEKYHATAFGIFGSSINTFLTVVYYAIGKLGDASPDSILLMVYASFACISFVFCILWLYLDWCGGMKCNAPSIGSAPSATHDPLSTVEEGDGKDERKAVYQTQSMASMANTVSSTGAHTVLLPSSGSPQ